MFSTRSRRALLIPGLAACVWVGVAAGAATQQGLLVKADQKAAALVAQLTLDEKVDQLLNVAPAIPRLGIPAYNWWTESLHGALGPVATTNFPVADRACCVVR